jgi:hypothetical protein
VLSFGIYQAFKAAYRLAVCSFVWYVLVMWRTLADLVVSVGQ